ncbi:hypothetical protein ACWC24_18850 [Streptomyces sp. NPDC001443]
MSRPSVELVRAQAAQYRERVADSCATALNGEETARVGKEAARAAARRAIHHAVTATWEPITLLGPLLLTAVLPWFIRWATPSATVWMPFPFSWLTHVIDSHDAPISHTALFWTGCALVLVVAAMLVLTGMLYERPPGALRAGRLALVHALALGIVTASLLLFAVSGGVHGGQWPTAREALVRTAAELAYIALLMLVIALFLVSVMAVASALLNWVLRPVLRPYDLLLLALVDACAVTHAHRGTWFLRRSRTVVERALQNAARKAESAVSARPFPGGRGPARADALRLAAVIRRHRTPIARASGPASFDRVTQSLWSGALALIDDDWEALTAAAPAVTVLSRLRRVAAAVWSPAVLLAAAVALPWIPAVAQAPAVADGVRVTLVITAVLGLVLPRESSAKASILDTLGKALPFLPEK